MAQIKASWSRDLTASLYTKMGSDCAFWFSPDAEALNAAEGILNGAECSIYVTTFGSKKIDEYKAKYRLTKEIYASFTDSSTSPSIFECLQGFDVRSFTLASYKDYISSIDKAKLPGILLDIPVKSLEDLTDREHELFDSYLGAAAYLTHVQDIIDSIFSLADELRTDGFYEVLDKYRSKIEEACSDTTKYLATISPLEYSDMLLRKKIRRRGPYSFFTFSPTVFSRYRAVRYFGIKQFLFFTLQDAVYDNECTLIKIKSLADDTRFRIISLLKEKGGLQGSKIVEATGLSPSTVSHHMKNLREAGLVHEEADGATKYYSLPTDITQKIIDALQEFLP
jgi:DNA-binding transcriptional ArsR family regulator